MANKTEASARAQPAVNGPGNTNGLPTSELSLRVYFEDTDAGGIVYHASYVRFMERGRTEWLRDAGVEHVALAREHDSAFVVSRMAIEFLAPARLDDVLRVTTSIKRVGRASVSLSQRVLDAAHATVHCTATVRLACVGATSVRPARIPAAVLDRVAAETGAARRGLPETGVR